MMANYTTFDTHEYHVHHLTDSDVEAAGDFVSLQLFKRVFIQRPINSKHAWQKMLILFCSWCEHNAAVLRTIDEFERTYRTDRAINWYTK